MSLKYRGLLLIVALTCITIFINPSLHANKVIVKIINSDTLKGKCPKTEEITKIIGDAIALGAPIYNAGLHNGCYRIYEWAAYKILYEHGKACTEVEKILKTAIQKSHGDYSDTEKAWMMREAFDKILGVPTKTREEEKLPAIGNG